jgi:hypothetical protein
MDPERTLVLLLDEYWLNKFFQLSDVVCSVGYISAMEMRYICLNGEHRASERASTDGEMRALWQGGSLESD